MMENRITSATMDRFPEVRFAMSTRQGGVSPEPLGMNLSFKVADEPGNVRRNRELFFGGLGITEARQAFPRQCHSAVVRCIRTAGEFESCDGLVTATSDLWLTISIADCVPVMLFDTKTRAVAALHAGWRGTVEGIVRSGIEIMKSEFRSLPSDLAAFIGPSASVCCYEVGKEVAAKFPSKVVTTVNGSLRLDLKEENRNQLLHEGVPSENIEVSSSCTICSPGLFHSFRREKERSGRMMAVIGIVA